MWPPVRGKCHRGPSSRHPWVPARAAATRSATPAARGAGVAATAPWPQPPRCCGGGHRWHAGRGRGCNVGRIHRAFWEEHIALTGSLLGPLALTPRATNPRHPDPSTPCPHPPSQLAPPPLPHPAPVSTSTHLCGVLLVAALIQRHLEAVAVRLELLHGAWSRGARAMVWNHSERAGGHQKCGWQQAARVLPQLLDRQGSARHACTTTAGGATAWLVHPPLEPRCVPQRSLGPQGQAEWGARTRIHAQVAQVEQVAHPEKH